MWYYEDCGEGGVEAHSPRAHIRYNSRSPGAYILLTRHCSNASWLNFIVLRFNSKVQVTALEFLWVVPRRGFHTSESSLPILFSLGCLLSHVPATYDNYQGISTSSLTSGFGFRSGSYVKISLEAERRRSFCWPVVFSLFPLAAQFMCKNISDPRQYK